jgi:hypothetical protein
MPRHIHCCGIKTSGVELSPSSLFGLPLSRTLGDLGVTKHFIAPAIPSSLLRMERRWQPTSVTVLFSTLYVRHHLLIYCCELTSSQISQRLIEAWRAPFSSAAWLILNTYFDDQPKYQESNSARVEYCKAQLKDNRFLYGPPVKVDGKVRSSISCIFSLFLRKVWLAENPSPFPWILLP